MYSIKFVIAGLLFCGLLGRVELFKFGKYGGPPPPPPPPPPPQPEQERLYAPLWLAPQQPSLLPLPPVSYQPEPLYQATEQQEQQGQGTKGGQRVEAERLGEASKGAPLPLAPLRQRPPALSYLIVRPVQSFGSYYEPQYQNYQAQFTRPAYLRDEDSSNLSTKGGQRAGQQREEQQQEQQQQQQVEEQQQTKEPIEQQEHIDEQQPQPQPPPPPPPTVVYTNHHSKEYKLRTLLERLKAKFTLGSSYQVVGEEYVQPIPPPQPLPARPPQPQQPVEQQQIQEQIPEQQQRELGFQEELPKQQPIQEQQQQQQQIEQHNQIRLEEEKGSKNVLIKQQEEGKGKRLAEKQTTQQQQQQLQESPLAQEPLRQNEPSKGQYNNNSGF